MAVVFWILRGTGLLTALGLLAVSWRAGVMVGTLLLCDVFAMVSGALPTASLWTQGALLAAVGALLGLLTLGREREPLWPMPAFASVVLGILTLSWYFDPDYAHDLIATWRLQPR